jgi:hypothetical protein
MTKNDIKNVIYIIRKDMNLICLNQKKSVSLNK